MPSCYLIEGLHRVDKRYEGRTALSGAQIEHLVAYLAQLQSTPMKKTVARKTLSSRELSLILPMGWVMPSAAAETQARRQQVAAAIAEVFGPNRTARAGKVQLRGAGDFGEWLFCPRRR